MVNISKMFIVPSSHTDYSWGYYLGPSLTHILRRDTEIIISVLESMRKEPRYKWILEKALMLTDFWMNHPEMREEFKRRVLEGRIEIPGGTISHPGILQASSGIDHESILRNIVQGRRFFQSVLGQTPKTEVLFLADVSYNHGQVPQIVKKSGCKYFIVHRPGSTLKAKGVPIEFTWEGIDGTKILTQQLLAVAGGEYIKSGRIADGLNKIIEYLLQQKKADGPAIVIQFSDWGYADAGLMDFVRKWNEEGSSPPINIATLTEAFKELEKQATFPIVKGGLDPVGIFTAMYGMGGNKIEALHKDAVDSLLTAETLASIAVFFGKPYPDGIFNQAWQHVTLYMDHAAAYYNYPQECEDIMEGYRWVASVSKDVAVKSFEFLADKVNTAEKEGRPIVVFNQLTWDRVDIAEVKVEFGPFDLVKNVKVIDGDGSVVPVQTTGEKRYPDGSYRWVQVIFKASVPALGYRVYYLRKTESQNPLDAVGLSFKENVLENDYFKVEFEKILLYRSVMSLADSSVPRDEGVSVHIKNIYDKKANRAIFEENGRYFPNEVICDTGHVGFYALGATFPGTHFSRDYPSMVQSPESDAYVSKYGYLPNIVEDSENAQNEEAPAEKPLIEVLEKGPVRIRVAVNYAVLDAKGTQEIVMYDGLPFIDFKTSIHNRSPNRRFRISFPVHCTDAKHFCDIPFGAEERNIEAEPHIGEEREGRGWDAPSVYFGSPVGLKGLFWALSWTDLSNSEYGLSLITKWWNTFMINGNCLTTIPLTSIDPERLGRFKIAHPVVRGIGTYEYPYRLYPHAGDCFKAKPFKQALEFRNPLLTITVDSHFGDLPNKLSFLKIEPDNLALSAFYTDTNGVVVRFYEATGKSCEAKITPNFPVKKVTETNLVDEEIRNLPLESLDKLPVTPFEIKTLRMER